MKKTLLLLFIFSTVYFAQWSTTIRKDTEYTNIGDVVSAIDDKNGGAFLIHGFRDYSIERTFLPVFEHIDKYGYKVTDGIEIKTLHDYSTEVQIHHSSDNNLFISFLDNTIYKYWNGLAVYAGKTAIIKIDTNGYPLWNEPVYAIIDTLNHNIYELIPDDSGGCFVSTSANYIETFASYGQKSIQHISSSGERLWSEQGVKLYEGLQANGLQFFPPKVHPRSDNDLFVYVVTNLSSTPEVYLISPNGEQLLNTSYVISRRIFNTFLSSEDALLILSYDNRGGPEARNLILGICTSINDTITFADTTVLSNLNNNLYHSNSYIDEKNNIHLLCRYDDIEGLVSYYKKISNKPSHLYDSLGIKLPEYSYNFLLENDTITFLQENGSLYRIDSLAQPIWGVDGLQFTLDDCLGPDAQIVSNNDNGIIVLWNECVSGVRGKLINKNGEIGIVTDIEETNNDYLDGFTVSLNYPNPFNPSTTIEYQIPKDGFVNLVVYNSLGQVVATLVNKYELIGKHSIPFNANNLPSGVYFYKLEIGSFSKVNKMLLLR